MNQAYADYEAIRAIINVYVEGVAAGDPILMRRIFHEDAHMFGYLDGMSRIVPIADFIARIEAQQQSGTTQGEHYSAEITSIDVQCSAASAKLLERDYNGRDFADYFHLLKTDGEWKIVSKTFAHF